MMETKQKLRRELKARIAGLSKEYCKAADREISQRLFSLEEYRRAKTVFCFVGTSGEIDTMPIILHALRKEKAVGVPLCTAPGVMEVRRITGSGSLISGSFGIMEPKAECSFINPAEIDLAVIPCLSCTEKGVRLGYGGGYYDRYLQHIRGFKLALCREKMLSESLILEDHDILMDGVLTEDSTRILKYTKSL